MEPALIFDHDPSETSRDTNDPIHMLLPWITNNTKVTVITQCHFSTPMQGILQHDTNNNSWSFFPGLHKLKDPKAQFMVDNKQLFKG